MGGVVALGILLGVLLMVWCRARKKQKRRFTLLAWRGPQYGNNSEKGLVGVEVVGDNVGSGGLQGKRNNRTIHKSSS